ncbi:uncharacterized protein LOC119694835 [Plutella xylostella]|uniref:uncharacterized protein LOC119694835 n=1 Tax=Plutella xylostella TaxID=51655 RepID=UPI002032C3F1|nr:uncharacterized protein LOC119694835 [Plutella xylostella]
MLSLVIFLLLAVQSCCGAGVLVLYQPLDVTAACVASSRLRYDTSFGMGMSDTITLVFRTLAEVDYQCEVEIVTERNYFLLVVIKFPMPVSRSCQLGQNAVNILRRGTSCNLCEMVDLRVSDDLYFSAVAKTRIKLQMTNNNTLNKIADNFYQVTATAARATNDSDCPLSNETLCTFQDRNYCFTSGVFCDGIRNCGVGDWFDETREVCGPHGDKLSPLAVATVVAAILLAGLALYRLLLSCLPSASDTFFTFSAMEDNRLRIDPVVKPPLREHSEFKEKESWVENSPSSSTTSSDSAGHPDVIEEELNNLSMKRAAAASPMIKEMQALELMEVDQGAGRTFSSGLRRLTVNIRGKILSFIRTPTFFGSTQADSTMKSNN